MSWTARIVQGEKWPRRIRITQLVDGIEQAVNLTGYDFRFVARIRGSEVLDLGIGTGIVLDDPVNGWLALEVLEAASSVLPTGVGKYQLWQTPPGGPRTVRMHGPFVVEEGFIV